MVLEVAPPAGSRFLHDTQVIRLPFFSHIGTEQHLWINDYFKNYQEIALPGATGGEPFNMLGWCQGSVNYIRRGVCGFVGHVGAFFTGVGTDVRRLLTWTRPSASSKSLCFCIPSILFHLGRDLTMIVGGFVGLIATLIIFFCLLIYGLCSLTWDALSPCCGSFWSRWGKD